MQAPEISTLEARQDSTPPPATLSELTPERPEPTTIAEDNNDDIAPPPVTTSTRPSRPQQQHSREVYVEEDEEDELIDDDDGASPSKTVPLVEQMPAVLHPAQHAIVPPPPPVADPALQTPPSSSVVPRKRAYKRKDKSIVGNTTSVATPGVPGSDDADAQASAKRRRVRSAPKATLEVKRQEPDLQQDAASLMMWRMNEDARPDLDANLHPQAAAAAAATAPSNFTPYQTMSTSPEKKKRGPRVGARDDLENGGSVSQSSVQPLKRNRSTKSGVAGPPRPERVPVDDGYSHDSYQSTHATYAEQNFAPFLQHQPDTYIPSHIDLAHVVDLDQFHVPKDMSPDDLPSPVLAAAPLRPLPYTTNAVDPANSGMWSWYNGPLDKRRCRTWGKVARTIRTIGGGTFLAKTWIGDAHSEIEHVRPPPTLMLEHQHQHQPPAISSAVSKASTPVPGKPSKPRKPRARKNVNNGDAALAATAASSSVVSAAPTPPIVKPQNGMADAAHELEMLAGGT
ncbi:hypothetical protein FRB93_011391 [Tulasnella sp. JGI-2019a]|nr:hypothetical protein FRB93_011391 [Tulasnella sp. JGI-2019a]